MVGPYNQLNQNFNLSPLNKPSINAPYAIIFRFAEIC